jgi:hypothetical protein
VCTSLGCLWDNKPVKKVVGVFVRFFRAPLQGRKPLNAPFQYPDLPCFTCTVGNVVTHHTFLIPFLNLDSTSPIAPACTKIKASDIGKYSVKIVSQNHTAVRIFDRISGYMGRT